MTEYRKYSKQYYTPRALYNELIFALAFTN